MTVTISRVHLQNSTIFKALACIPYPLYSSNSQGKAGQLVFALVFTGGGCASAQLKGCKPKYPQVQGSVLLSQEEIQE